MGLEVGFERKLQEALLDDVEQKMVGEQDGIVHRFVQRCHELLEAYGERHDYDVQPVIDSLGEPGVTRTEDSIEVRIGWEHPAAPYFQMGTSDHTIDGDPVLSFVWDKEDAPRWVKKEFEREGTGYRVFFQSVDVQGLPESRFVRTALHWFREMLT